MSGLLSGEISSTSQPVSILVFFGLAMQVSLCSQEGGRSPAISIIEIRDIGDAGEDEDNKQEFVCDSCGATVITDYNTSATFCAFCGSPTLINRRLSRCFRPDLIIPFKVSKEEAIENYLKWTQTHKGIPKKFTSESVLSKITGYYIPFWLLDADCVTDVSGTGQKYQGENVANYAIDRTVVYHVRRVPFDGCKKISNTLMEAIEPFNYSEMRDYNDMYLPGYFAQRYDLSAIDMIDIIRIRFDNYAEGIVKRLSATEYDQFKTVGVKGSYSENYQQVYALMPVWFLNIEYDGSTYGIAVNGQTGKASGSLPVNKKRVHMHALGSVVLDVLKFMAITLVISIVASTIMFILTSGREANTLYWIMVLVLFIIENISGLLFLVPHINKKFRDNSFYESVTNDKAPNIDEYVDLKTNFRMDNRDSFTYMSTKKDVQYMKEFEKVPLSEKLMKSIFK